MAIKINCDVCGQLMGSCKINEIKTFHKKHGEKCAECIKMENELTDFIEKKRAFWAKRFNQLVEECRKYMLTEVEGLLEKRADRFELKRLQEEEDKRQQIIDEYKNAQVKGVKIEEDENGKRNDGQHQAD